MKEQGVDYKNEAKHYEDAFEEQLTTIIDPEIGIDIVNLGLIYDIDLDEVGHCAIDLTFTSTGCSCQDIIFAEIHEKLQPLDFINDLVVNIVWQPAWNMSRITRLGRISLGINPN